MLSIWICFYDFFIVTHMHTIVFVSGFDVRFISNHALSPYNIANDPRQVPQVPFRIAYSEEDVTD